MKLVRPLEVLPGVYQLRAIGARVTALFGEEGIVLVDAGGRGSLPFIARGLKTVGASLQQVRMVIITHYHPDHTGELAKLVEATAVKVAVHRQEAGFVHGSEPFPNPFRNPLLAGATQPFISLLYPHPVKVDLLLEDGQELPVLGGIRVVHTPGHTPGSICLYVASKKLFIVGDALQCRFRRLTGPARRFTQDPQQARESLKKLMAFDFQTICFSHFPPLREGAREALIRLIQRMDGDTPRNRR